MKKVFLIGVTLMCFASMAGCKTKPPKVAHPYVKEYVASYKTGSVNVKDFLDQLGQMKMEKRYLKTLRKHLRR